MLRKLQNQPPHVRKLIFWSILALVALAMLFWWWQNTKRRFSGIKGRDFIIQQVQPPKIELPAIDIPEINLPQDLAIPETSTKDDTP